MNIRRLITICFATTVCLFSLSACQDKDDDVDGFQAGNSFINLSIAISDSQAHGTRAVPAGIEPSDYKSAGTDGREAGFERENKVTAITLILYRDEAGINTTANPTLELVRHFPVTLADGTEAYYTTGNQPLGRHRLSLSATYHAIVIANTTGEVPALTEGSSRLSDIRDAVLTKVYTPSASKAVGTEAASACEGFVMTSEQDYTINFGSITATNLDGSAHSEGEDRLYDLSSQPLVIERMAARIDFWAKNSNGYVASYATPGYEYNVVGSDDKFVVTGIMPFNLADGHAGFGSEYLLKRLAADKSQLAAATQLHLADETTTSFVLDPLTLRQGETAYATPTLTNDLGSVYKSLSGIESNAYFHAVKDMHGSTDASLTIDGKEDVVVAYPMENCLLPASRPYYHATGIALVGYYYEKGSATGTRYVYLGYLRHQGSSESYDVYPSTTPLSATETMGEAPAMKYGVVRNNIYRVTVESVASESTVMPPMIRLMIRVKKWDKFEHDPIYI